ncbi:diaminopimelate decarboxylase family protein [Bifidobacterium cuniculi]|uniref:Diaminopimelate decarboxylase n=1 Tax=Bifidobacterium cuniculi TaxID=1688 RepID=A0A087B586_9BIFI|nr:diaminopimelate decarboxylase [Bifidobacterium cuniculi]KFI66186.1 diaminopimelate decarboxylase [Bifidobacterium cuniculi]
MLTFIWPTAADRDDSGAIAFHGITAAQLLDEFGSPLYVIDVDEVRDRARFFRKAAQDAFANTTVHVSYAAKAFLSKQVARIVTEAGLYLDTCTMGEMRIALAAGVPGRRLVLHGNNKSDEEIALAIREGFDKIVVDEPGEPARIARIARELGKRARVMLRVTSGIHAGGHEYVSTAHEDQKFGVALLPVGADTTIVDRATALADASPAVANALMAETRAEEDGRTLDHSVRYPYDLKATDVTEDDRILAAAMELIANGPALQVLQAIAKEDDALELVGIHTHIGSNIHDADAFIQSARRMMLLRKTFYATNGVTLPEVDLGGGYSVAYTDGEDAMDVRAELARLAGAVGDTNRILGMPMPVISFEPGRWIVAPAGVTLYRVGTVKTVQLAGVTDDDGHEVAERTYVSVDGGMSDNIRPALYDADYTAALANREGSEETRLSRVVGMHCESGDIVVKTAQLPADITRGDLLAVPVTGAYGRTMASNYNQALIPAVVAVGEDGAHVMMRRQTVEDLLDLDVSE